MLYIVLLLVISHNFGFAKACKMDWYIYIGYIKPLEWSFPGDRKLSPTFACELGIGRLLADFGEAENRWGWRERSRDDTLHFHKNV